eukprot:COSAG02_NODE_1198_length_13931_cov_66.449754_10_plen_153_part_00
MLRATHADWQRLKGFTDAGDWAGAKTLLAVGSTWGRLAWQAVAFFKANEGYKVHDADTERQLAYEVLTRLDKIRGESLESLISDELYSDREEARPTAVRLIKTLTQFAGEDPPEFSEVLRTAMAQVAGFRKDDEIRVASASVQRRALEAAIR